MAGVADTATSSNIQSDRGIGRREYFPRRNLVDRVLSDDDAFSCPEKSTSTVDEANQLRTTRQSRTTEALAQLDELFLEDFGERLAQASRNDVNAFMTMNFRLPAPILSAEPDGTILATWRFAPQSLVIRFKGQNLLDYAIAYSEGAEIKRKWGTTHFVNFFGAQPEALRVANSVE